MERPTRQGWLRYILPSPSQPPSTSRRMVLYPWRDPRQLDRRPCLRCPSLCQPVTFEVAYAATERAGELAEHTCDQCTEDPLSCRASIRSNVRRPTLLLNLREGKTATATSAMDRGGQSQRVAQVQVVIVCQPLFLLSTVIWVCPRPGGQANSADGGCLVRYVCTAFAICSFVGPGPAVGGCSVR